MSARNPHFERDQRAFFDDLVTTQWPTYTDPIWDQSRRLEVDQIIARSGPARRVLDVGCGCGFHDVVLAELPGVDEVVGIDSSAKSIEVANREYAHARVTRRVDDILSMPAGEFDLVTSFQVIEHMDRPGEFLRACALQARTGGHVAVVTPNRRRLANRVFRALGRGEPLSDELHFDEYSVQDLTVMGEALDLALVGAFGRDVKVPFRDRPFGLLPVAIGRQLGRMVPAVAEVIGVVFSVRRQQ